MRSKNNWGSQAVNIEERLEASVVAWPRRWEHTYHSGRPVSQISSTWDFLNELNFEAWTRNVAERRKQDEIEARELALKERRERKLLWRRRAYRKKHKYPVTIAKKAELAANRAAKYKLDMADPVKFAARRQLEREVYAKKKEKKYTEQCKGTSEPT